MSLIQSTLRQDLLIYTHHSYCVLYYSVLCYSVILLYSFFKLTVDFNRDNITLKPHPSIGSDNETLKRKNKIAEPVGCGFKFTKLIFSKHDLHVYMH